VAAVLKALFFCPLSLCFSLVRYFNYINNYNDDDGYFCDDDDDYDDYDDGGEYDDYFPLSVELIDRPLACCLCVCVCVQAQGCGAVPRQQQSGP
jgi:hypothetical protein